MAGGVVGFFIVVGLEVIIIEVKVVGIIMVVSFGVYFMYFFLGIFNFRFVFYWKGVSQEFVVLIFKFIEIFGGYCMICIFFLYGSEGL